MISIYSHKSCTGVNKNNSISLSDWEKSECNNIWAQVKPACESVIIRENSHISPSFLI